MSTKLVESLKFLGIGGAIGAVSYFLLNKKSQSDQNDTSAAQDMTNQNTGEQIGYLNQEQREKLKNSFVVVVGVGGVGSHVINTLARAGIKKFRIIDFDLVTLSSLNRHAFTFRDDVGASKVGSTKKYLERIYPDIECEVVEEFLK